MLLGNRDAQRRQVDIHGVGVAFVVARRDVLQVLSELGERELDAVAAKPNGRRRKTLGCKTPAEALDHVLTRINWRCDDAAPQWQVAVVRLAVDALAIWRGNRSQEWRGSKLSALFARWPREAGATFGDAPNASVLSFAEANGLNAQIAARYDLSVMHVAVGVPERVFFANTKAAVI